MSSTDLPSYADSSIDPIVQVLFEQDIAALEALRTSGWDINRPLRVSIRMSVYPINLALWHGKLKALDFLLDHGAELNFAVDPPLLAAIYSHQPWSVIQRLLAQGARPDVKDQVGSGIYQAASAAKRWDLLPEFARRRAHGQRCGRGAQAGCTRKRP